MYEQTAHSVCNRPVEGIVLLFVMIISTFSCSQQIHAQNDNAFEIEQSVQEWLNLREQIQREKQGWQNEQQILEQELDVLKKREKILATQLKATKSSLGDLHRELERLESSVTRKDSEVDKLVMVLSKAETALQLYKEILPELLQRQVKLRLAGAAEKDISAAEAVAPTRQLKKLLKEFALLEELDHKFHAGRMLLHNPKDNELEMDVIFIGLSCGYAVAPDDTAAAFGYISGKNWQWEWDAKLAGGVRALLSALEDRTTTDLVHIPLEISELD